MALETGNYVNDLVITNPAASDNVSAGDDHLRLLKKIIKQSFPSVDAAVNAIHTSASAPATSISAGLLWFDTTNNLLKLRNEANDNWITLAVSVATDNSVDVNAGTIDGAVIGGSATAAGTFAALEGTTVKATTSLTLDTGVDVVFEGATADAYETTVTVTDPTADRTITLPNATDTLVGKATTDTLTNKTMSGSSNTFSAIPNSGLADMAANTVKVRDANSSGAPSDVAVTDTQILIGDGTGFTAAALSGDASMTNAGVVTVDSIQGTAVSSTSPTNDQYMKYSSTSSEWQMVSIVGTDKLTTKGDLLAYNTVDSETRFGIGTNDYVLTADSTATNGFDWKAASVADGTVTNAKLSDMASNTIKVRDASSSGVPSDKAVADTQIIIGDGTGFTAASLSGDVTMTNAGAVTIATDAVDIPMLSATGTASATTYLRGDNAWSTIETGTSWQSVQTTGFTAVAGNGYPCNTTSGAFTVTLPASASVGDTIELVDYAGTWDTNILTLDPQSLNLKGATTDLSLAYERQGVRIVYVDATQGWVVASGANESNPAAQAPAYMSATGPDTAAGVTDGDYKYHIFTATKTGSNGFAVSSVGNAAGSNSVEYLVIAGGAGGGGYYYAGGGGAGGFRNSCVGDTLSGRSSSLESKLGVSVQNYNVTIGAGGAAQTTTLTYGNAGSDSVFSTITSTGGGSGQAGSGAPTSGADGGCGGGGTGSGWDTSGAGGGNGTVGQGGDGGAASEGHGGGGGGAKENGADATGSNSASGSGGDGGDGLPSVISGSTVTRGGGGGGGAYSTSDMRGDGGAGGGGNGGGGSGQGAASAGTVNTGSGGGGGNHTNSSSEDGAAGGSGIVVIRYKFQN